jgi:hypothetical protein
VPEDSESTPSAGSADHAAAPSGGKPSGGVKGVITKKVGPLPLWAYAAMVGVALLVWKAKHKSAQSSESQAAVAGGTDIGSTDYSTGQDINGAASGSLLQSLEAQLAALQANQKTSPLPGKKPGGAKPKPVAPVNPHSKPSGIADIKPKAQAPVAGPSPLAGSSTVQRIGTRQPNPVPASIARPPAAAPPVKPTEKRPPAPQPLQLKPTYSSSSAVGTRKY